MNSKSRHRRFSIRAALLAAALLLAVPAGRAFAEGEEGGESIEQQVKAQIDKIIKLMRENEKALLDASRGSGKKPDGVEVKPPDTAAMESGTPPAGEPPPLRGEEVRKRLDELLKTSQGSGAAIPNELEALVKMIPVTGGQGQGQGQQGEPDPKPGTSGSTEPRDANRPDKPEAAKDPKEASKPENPAQKPGERGSTKPPDGEKSDPTGNDDPPWLVNLPEEYRRMITSGDTEKVPPRYRHLVEDYAKWLADHAKGGTSR